MKVGIVGLPLSGKTTLFRALTRGNVSTDTHGDRPNVGVVSVPDRRVDFMAAEYKPKKVTYASIEFIDGAARVSTEDGRAHFAAGFFGDVRQVDALVHVVRGFEQPTGEQPAPVKDVQTLNDELAIADLQVVENRIERLEKQLHGVKKGTTTPATIEMALIERIREHLEAGKPLKEMELADDERKAIRGYEFLTLKPIVAVLNIPEDSIGKPGAAAAAFEAYCDQVGVLQTQLSVEVEMEVAELSDEEETEFLQSMGINRPARDVLIQQCHEALGLVSFVTANQAEVRAWTLKQGLTAIDAAATVHSDMARGFIRAEVANYAQIEAAGGWEAAKQQGITQLHGKDYVVHDGDIIYIRFKV